MKKGKDIENRKARDMERREYWAQGLQTHFFQAWFGASTKGTTRTTYAIQQIRCVKSELQRNDVNNSCRFWSMMMRCSSGEIVEFIRLPSYRSWTLYIPAGTTGSAGTADQSVLCMADPVSYISRRQN
jgi:hypothetical protein